MPKSKDQLIQSLVKRIAEDRTHGASELARDSLARIVEFVESSCTLSVEELEQDTLQLARLLKQTRPSMVILQNVIDRWIALVSNQRAANAGEFSQIAIAAAQQLITLSANAAADAARQAAQLLQPGHTIMTHSYSSTICKLLTQMAPKPIRCIITESQPGKEGQRLAAALSSAKIDFDYITDAQMALFVKHADCVVVGADTLLADGSVVNKAGTCLLALAAREARVPFYVCSESFKASQFTSSSMVIESGPVEELQTENLPGMNVCNLTFDITPAYLISAWVTENGVCQVYDANAPGNLA